MQQLPTEELPTGHFIVSPDVLISHIWQVCEMVLNISLVAVTRDEMKESAAISSSIATMGMNNNRSCLLVVKCDDSLLDAIFENKPFLQATDVNIKTLNVLSNLANIISSEITGIFQDNQCFGFPTAPEHSKSGIIAETVLKHASGCIHIFLTTLESNSNTPFSSPDLDKFFHDIGAWVS